MRNFIAAVALSVMATSGLAQECDTDHLSVRGDWGQLAFSVEIADDPQERSRGLMFRESLARGAGMLFIYETPQPTSFWMKNTLIPLDMLFADITGKITSVHSNAIPGDLTAIPGGSSVFAVLEINGGLAKRYGIAVGSQMRHPAFTDGPAAWPC
jgi:uncharacterized membrane protein (UPF0127 family)